MGSNSWDQVVKGCDLRSAGPRAFLAGFSEQAAALKRPMWQGMEGSFWRTAPWGPNPANNPRVSLEQTLPAGPGDEGSPSQLLDRSLSSHPEQGTQ